MGLMAAVGELATALGILPWPDGEASRAAATCFAAWVVTRGGTGPAALASGIEQVRRYVAQHGACRFVWRGGDETAQDRAGWVRGGGDESGKAEYLILPAVWRAEVCAGHDAGAIAAAPAEAGHLRWGSEGKLSRVERLPGVGARRVYVLRASILGEGGDDD